jgi:hypothetical protein
MLDNNGGIKYQHCQLCWVDGEESPEGVFVLFTFIGKEDTVKSKDGMGWLQTGI